MKYELTDIKRDYYGTTIYRIRALKDIENKNELQLDVKIRCKRAEILGCFEI